MNVDYINFDHRGLQVGRGTRVGVDNHSLYTTEFLDYSNVQCCCQ